MNKHYVITRQLPYCCVPACLLMVFDRRGISKFSSQRSVGYLLGLAVPAIYRKCFPKALRRRPSSGWGTQIQNKRYSIQSLLRRHHLPMKFVYRFPKNYKEFIALLKMASLDEVDVIVCFNYGVLYRDPDANWGHVSIIESVHNRMITLVDPEKTKRRQVSAKNLFEAIKKHSAKNAAGFWIFSPFTLSVSPS